MEIEANRCARLVDRRSFDASERRLPRLAQENQISRRRRHQNDRHQHVLARDEEGFLRRCRLWRCSRFCCAALPITMQALVSESLVSWRWARLMRPLARRRAAPILLAVGGVVNGLTQAIVAGKELQEHQRFARRDHRRASPHVRRDQCSASAFSSKTVLNYPADYKLLAVGGGNFNLAALMSGQIGATYLVVPLDYTAEQQGFNVLGYFRDYFPNYQLSLLTVKRGWAEKNRGCWCAFSKAPCGPIAGFTPIKKPPSIFSPKKFLSNRSLARARMGVLHDQSHLASQRGDQSGRIEVYDANLCRADQRAAARSAEIYRSELSATGDSRIGRALSPEGEKNNVAP